MESYELDQSLAFRGYILWRVYKHPVASPAHCPTGLQPGQIGGKVSMGPRAALEEQNAGTGSFEPLIDNIAAAELLGIHPKTLQRMARRGDIPAIRVGRYWRFRASQLDSWIESQLHSSCQPCRTNL
jgi:excisionase family DNA binding protein